MAVTFGGYRYGGTGANVSSINLNPNSGGTASAGNSCNAGDWMIVVITGGSNLVDTNVPGDGAGWTIVRSYSTMTGATAFQTGIWMKRRELGETSYTWPLDGTGNGVYWTILWYNGAQDAFAGAFWDRNGNATSVTNIAPSVTTTVDNSLVVSISTERTVATETDSQISVDNGMTKQCFTQQPTSGDQNVSVADKTVVIAGTSGDTTWTYPNAQTNNGVAGHIWFTPSAAPTSGAPYIVSTAETITAGSGSSITINVPSGYQTGDLLVAALRNQASNSPTDWVNAAFTRAGPAFVANSTTARVTGFYTHEITGTEPASYTFTVGVSASRSVGALFLVRGADPSWVAYYDSATGDAITNGRTIPSYAANDPALVLEFAASEFASPNDHIPSNYPDNFTQITEVYTSSNTGISRTYMWLGSRELTGTASTVGSTDTDIAWGAPSAPVALSIAFRPAGTLNPDFTAKIGDTGGILTDVTVRVGDTGNTLSQISGMRAMLPRYYNVSQMLSLPEFFWAHRGGSRDFPEMSSYAYGQSALISYGCLELSLARTSDGVWFGLHDADINRTSGTTGLAAASAMTWATVQGYQILGSMAANNSTQPNRPYAKLQDILDAYSKHLFVVDIKYANTYREELLDILDSYGGPERFVGKAYGVGSTSFATSCANRGYQTWGYFYASDIPSLTSQYVNQWTIIGMDYTAAQSDWDTLAGYRTNGQRMSGHICPDSSAVATARSKGATGFMVSGVESARPLY